MVTSVLILSGYKLEIKLKYKVTFQYNILYNMIKIYFFLFILQDWWDNQIESRGYAFWLSYLPKILLAIGITLLDEAYYKVAVWLNDKGKVF